MYVMTAAVRSASYATCRDWRQSLATSFDTSTRCRNCAASSFEYSRSVETNLYLCQQRMRQLERAAKLDQQPYRAYLATGLETGRG